MTTESDGLSVTARGRKRRRFGRLLLLPEDFVVTVDRPQLPYTLKLEVRVTENGPQCVVLECSRRKGGAAVSGAGIRRLPIAQLVREAAVLLAGKIVEETDEAIFVEPLTLSEESGADTELRRDRWKLTDDFLKEVSTVYRRAVAQGDPAPVWAVADRYGRPRPTASRWVATARAAGHLPRPNKKEHR